MKRVIIGVRGGLVQWVCSNTQYEDIEVVIMDFDIDGECDESRIFGNIASVHSEFASKISILDPEVRLALDEFDHKQDERQ